MIVARNQRDMLDMVGNEANGCRRFGVALVPRVHRCFSSFGLTVVIHLAARFLAGTHCAPGGHRLRQMPGKEVHHDHAAVHRDAPEDIVGHVARMIVECPGARMREHHRRLGRIERVHHCFRADMTEV